jgi:vancomycin permeability regulator SanA
MNRVASSAMILGDLIVLLISSLFLVFRSSYTPWLSFDLSISIIPYLLSWFCLASAKHAYDLSLPKRDFIQRSILLWFVSILPAEAMRFILKYLLTSTTLTFPGIVIELVEMSIIFILWKFGSYAVYRHSSRPENQNTRRILLASIFTATVLGLLVTTPFIWSVVRYSNDIYSLKDTPYTDAALVPGAGIWSDGTPSITLIERVESASELYRMGKIRFIVLSGSQQETEVMMQLAEDSGINQDALLIDPRGFSTLNSCINLFQDRAFHRVAVVSQKYHLFRALYFCTSVGIESIGVSAESQAQLPETILRRYLREIGATVMGFLEIETMKLWR